MGDRTYVCLSVPQALKETALDIMGAAAWEPDNEEHSDAEAQCWGFEDVNYGELPFLDDLRDNGIAYVAGWSKGDEYPEGEEALRFTESGEVILKERYEGDDCIHFSSIDLILNDRNKSPYQKLEDIRIITDEIKEKSTDLPWENQEVYGKLYQAKQLLQT